MAAVLDALVAAERELSMLRRQKRDLQAEILRLRSALCARCSLRACGPCEYAARCLRCGSAMAAGEACPACGGMSAVGEVRS